MISVGRNAAWLVFDGQTEPIVASLRKNVEMRTMLVPGDLVDAVLIEEGRAIVERRHERSFALERRSYKGKLKTMAANVDTIAIVAAVVEPPIRRSMVDQLLAFAELEELRALLLLTKADLPGGQRASEIAADYANLGYRVLVVQPKAGEGVEALRGALRGTSALLVGQSGVGKSSIFRALGGSGAVGAVSRLGRGKQTTTAARLFAMPDGFLIDSPGVGAFELGTITATELTQAFVEFRAPATHCRFRDCAHLAEPGCAVRAAVEDGTIQQARYESYRLILASGDPLSRYD